MAKHLIDLDEEALRSARAELGTATIKETVNEALRRVGGERADVVARRLEALAGMELLDRENAWR